MGAGLLLASRSSFDSQPGSNTFSIRELRVRSRGGDGGGDVGASATSIASFVATPSEDTSDGLTIGVDEGGIGDGRVAAA